MSLEPYATTDELAVFWRTIEPSDDARAEDLLKRASNLLRQISKNNGSDLDSAIESDESGLFGENVKTVILEAVKRSLSKPSDAPPADQWSQSASPYSETMTFTNPSSDIYFKTNELRLLKLAGVNGRSQFGVLSGVR